MDVMIDQQQARRLIVLVTNSLADQVALAQWVHWIAEREHLAVLYLVLENDPRNFLLASRNMATVKALTAEDGLWVDVKVIEAGGWLHELRRLAGPGDLIISQKGEAAGRLPVYAVPVSEFLSDYLGDQVRTTSAYANPPQPEEKRWYQHMLSVAGFLLIILAFSWLEIVLDRQFSGSLVKLLLMGFFGAEIAAVLAWSKVM